MNKNKPEGESRLIIQNQHFSSKTSLAKYVEWDALAGISFVSCTFENVQLGGKVFGTCSFQDCIFNDFVVRKATFSNCCFEDCKITDSDMTRGDFYKTYFKNCEFSGVDLAASDFYSCKFKKTKFFRSNLDLIIARNVKVWKSKEWVKIEDFSSFQKDSDE